MIGTLRKHQKWLWMLIITVTIISFVIFFSPDAKFKGNYSRESRKIMNGSPVTMYGQPISNDEFNQAWRQTVLGYFMRSGGGEWPGGDEQTKTQLDRDTISRILMLKKVQELDIHISDNAVALAAHDRLRDFPIKQFDREYLAPHGFTIPDFEDFLRSELAIQQLFSTATVSGKLFSPQEAEKLFRKDHEQNDTRVAIFWASNYLDKVAVTDLDLTNYYVAHPTSYRLPDRVVVDYVEFPATNFLAEADKEIAKQTNFNAIVDEYYFKQGTNAFKSTNGTLLSEADAKKKIKDDFREQLAMREARKKATDFGNQLYNLPQPDRAENLLNMAKTNGFTVKTSPPLERYSTNETEFSREFREAAHKTTSQMPVAFNPVPGETAFYLMALNKKIPTTIQSFDDVKARVAEDFKHNKALELAKSAGTAFYSAVTNGLAQKKTWDQLATEARVETVKPPLFSSVTTASSVTNLDERVKLTTLQALAERMKPGDVSNYEPAPSVSPEGGIIVYLKDKLPVDDATLKKDLPQYLTRMRAYRQDEAFKQYFRKLVDQSKLYVAPPEKTSSGG